MVVVLDCTRADIDFQGRHAGEALELYFHQHWVRLAWPFTKMLLRTALIGAAGYVTLVMFVIDDPLTRRLTLGILSLFFLLAHFEFLSRVYRYLLYVIVVTDRKVHRIKKTLLATDDHLSVDLWMIQDINKCQHSVIQNLLGFGSIELEAQNTILRLHFTPRIGRVYERIMHLRERAREGMAYYGGMRYGVPPGVPPMQEVKA